MTTDQARALAAGARVRFTEDAEGSLFHDGTGASFTDGTVTRAAPHCVNIAWDDGGFSSCHPSDMDRISVLEGT